MDAGNGPVFTSAKSSNLNSVTNKRLYTVRFSVLLSAVLFLPFTIYPQTTEKPVLTKIGGITVPQSEYAQNQIQKYIDQYTKNFGRQQLYDVLEGGEAYRLYIRQELKKRNMPPALEYLPFVESEFNPKAVSRSGAKGLWQFMDNSIAGLLKKTEWEDQRYDPWKSTDAALSKLQENYKTFKDWPIAIAAYNCGAGAMKKTLKESPQKNFWYIAEKGLLRDQSVQYIPKLLAICQLCEKSELYGLSLPEETESPFFSQFDYLEIKTQVYLDCLSQEMKIDPSILLYLNPALLKGCTPPSSYTLRLPSGMKESAVIALANLKKQGTGKPPITHTVQQGETLWSISRKYNVSVSTLRTLNGMSEKDTLSIGKTLYIQ